ncbi:MAG TPA: hypothetical protein VFM18_22990 [Methanosarcina sp.]|nr:hypothetical protein [Methanosarcina sp.]
MMLDLFNEIKPYSFRFAPVYNVDPEYNNRDFIQKLRMQKRERQIRKEIKKTMGSTRGVEIYWLFEYEYRPSAMNVLNNFLENELKNPVPHTLLIEHYKEQIAEHFGSSGYWTTALVPYAKFKNEWSAVIFRLKYQELE